MRCILVLLAAAAVAAAAPRLAKPFRVMSGDKPVDTEIGHAAPCFADYDRDGLADLLVGQFGDGRLRIYRNTGEPGAPRFDGFEYFAGTVPAG